jgi:hypothetical protein
MTQGVFEPFGHNDVAAGLVAAMTIRKHFKNSMKRGESSFVDLFPSFAGGVEFERGGMRPRNIAP